ncbi:MAG: glycosyltransferase [Lachnospirales bacterium]
MNNCLISIIVPVYNAEKYICQCMDSLVNQTLESIEIIAIDDGSTDNSLNILEKYKNNDSRVKIICQKNSGASVARNKGLEMAQGDYIFFLDADDYIDNSAFSAMYENAIKYNVDIITFNCKSFSDENDNVAERYNRSLDDRKNIFR